VWLVVVVDAKEARAHTQHTHTHSTRKHAGKSKNEMCSMAKQTDVRTLSSMHYFVAGTPH